MMSGRAPPFNILIVEDDLGVSEILSRWLADEGYVVRTAGSAEEGIRIANYERMDIILTDLCLPGMNGFTAIPTLRGERNTPILVMTGYDDEEFRKDAVCFGAADLILKPFTHTDLMRIVRRIAVAAKVQACPELPTQTGVRAV